MAAAERAAPLALRLGAVVTNLHAARVLIFALGRIEPFVNFDVRAEHHASHAARWRWGQVAFASTLSGLEILGVLVIWRLRGRRRRR